MPCRKKRLEGVIILIVYLLYTSGDLCSQCEDDYGITLDLRRCVDDSTCGALGVTIFVLTCK